MNIFPRENSGKLRSPPNYSSRRVQYRLMILVGMLMVVILLMVEAAKPKNWDWMWGGQPPAGETSSLDPQEFAPGDVETRLPRQPASEGPAELDVFISPAESDPPEFEATTDSGGSAYFAGVRPDLLDTVRDDRVFGNAEHDAWFHLLAILRVTHQQDLEHASTGHVGFIQLFKQPGTYRGKLLTVRGTVRRAHRVKAPRNDFGIQGYYICWLRPAGGPNSPIIVYSLDVPEGFPVGMDVFAQTEFTGFSYKRLAYNAEDGSRTAPLVLAKSATWEAPEEKESRPLPSTPAIALAVAGTAGLGVILASMAYLVSRRRTAEAYGPQSRMQTQRLNSLKGEELAPTTEQVLRTLADN